MQWELGKAVTENYFSPLYLLSLFLTLKNNNLNIPHSWIGIPADQKWEVVEKASTALMLYPLGPGHIQLFPGGWALPDLPPTLDSEQLYY